MQTQLSPLLLSTEAGREANAILRRCVHCGFCNATCPTYQLTGDELDGPRGRVYLIKEFLEGQGDGKVARLHLDRCLTCRNCETTCPSGVEYGRLLDVGREQIEQQTSRPLPERVFRWGLSTFLSRSSLFKLALNVAGMVRIFLPTSLRDVLPSQQASEMKWPQNTHMRRVILMRGCVQKVIEPGINTAAARVLDRLSINAIQVDDEVCCGALDQHLTKTEKAERFMRHNIDVWWPTIEQGVEAIVSTASACGLQVKDYGHYLRKDSLYAEKAKRVSELAKDIAEVVSQEEVQLVSQSALHSTSQSTKDGVRRVAFHAPCTLQHGQRLDGVVEDILNRWGFETVPVTDSHLCCGSAGTYSILNPELANALRDNKLTSLQAHQADVIASANVGCLQHMRKKASVPVKHWIELLADCQQGH